MSGLSIDTPLLIVGHGPAALVAAKVASGYGMSSLLAGHEPIADTEPVVLDERSRAVLEPHGVLGVLRPYAATQEPFTIAPLLFEQGLKHHCVADMLIMVYDAMTVALADDAHNDDVARGCSRHVEATLTDGRSRWSLRADTFLDVVDAPADLNEAIGHAADFVRALPGVRL